MSIAESFSLFPLSKYFVVKATGAGFNTDVGETQPIASGLIQNDAVNNIGGVTGYYTWYRLSHYGEVPQELKEKKYEKIYLFAEMYRQLPMVPVLNWLSLMAGLTRIT
jgi:hypothetical protein